MKIISFNHMRVVRINAPEWYRRADFVRWLAGRGEGLPPATWYRSGEVDESHDVFVTYDEGDGSDSPMLMPPDTEFNVMPADIWEQIHKAITDRNYAHCFAPPITECLIWISNLEEDEETKHSTPHLELPICPACGGYHTEDQCVLVKTAKAPLRYPISFEVWSNGFKRATLKVASREEHETVLRNERLVHPDLEVRDLQEGVEMSPPPAEHETDRCEECGAVIPVVEGGGLMNKHHLPSCSCYDPDEE